MWLSVLRYDVLIVSSFAVHHSFFVLLLCLVDIDKSRKELTQWGKIIHLFMPLKTIQMSNYDLNPWLRYNSLVSKPRILYCVTRKLLPVSPLKVKLVLFI